MDKKQQVSLPKFIWVLAGILVVCIIFLIAVQIPFSQKIDTYNKDHASAESQISVYEDYLKRADTVKKQIEELKKEISAKNEKLSIDPNKTVDDIRDLLEKHDMDLSTLNISEGFADPEGGVSASGDPLYVTTVTYTFTASRQKLQEALTYFESESKGAYFITNISVVKREERAVEESGAESSKVSVTPAGTLFDTTLTISLYYFDPTKNEAASAAETAPAEGTTDESAEA